MSEPKTWRIRKYLYVYPRPGGNPGNQIIYSIEGEDCFDEVRVVEASYADRLAEERDQLRAENEQLKHEALQTKLGQITILERERDELHAENERLRSDNTKELLIAIEEQQRLRTANAALVEALRDADFVFEGSQAIEGQSDELLDKRERAIMRFLEALEKYGGVR